MHCESDSSGSCINLKSGICSPYIEEGSAECLPDFIDCIEWQATLAPAEMSTLATTPTTIAAGLATNLSDCLMCSSEVEYVCGKSGQQYDNFCFASCVGDYPWTVGPCATNFSTGGGVVSMSNNQTKMGSKNDTSSAVHTVMWIALALLPVALVAMAVINGKIMKERATLKTAHEVHWQHTDSHTASDVTADSGSEFKHLDDGFNLEDNPFSSNELQWDVSYSPEAPPMRSPIGNQTGSPLASRMSWAKHFSREPTPDQIFGSPLANLAKVHKFENADPQIFSSAPKSSLSVSMASATLRRKGDSVRMVDESILYTAGDPQLETDKEMPMYALAKPKAPRLAQKLPTYLEPDVPGYALATQLETADYAMAKPPVTSGKPGRNSAVASPPTATADYGRGRLASPVDFEEEGEYDPVRAIHQSSEPEYESEAGGSDDDGMEPIYARASTSGSTNFENMSGDEEREEDNSPIAE